MTELPTYTSLFRVERRLYAVYDLELPVPVGLFQAGVFAVTAALSVLALELLGPGLTAGTAWVVVVPPAFASWGASRPLVEGRRPHRWAWSQLRHVLEPRRLDGPARRREPERVELVASVVVGGP